MFDKTTERSLPSDNSSRSLETTQINSSSTNSIVSLSSTTRTVTTTVQQRLARTTTNSNNSRIVINAIFLELAEKFLLHYSQEFYPHKCSNKCVAEAEKNIHQLPKTMNQFLKPFACRWTIIENVRIRKLTDIRLKANGSTLIYCSPCKRTKTIRFIQ